MSDVIGLLRDASAFRAVIHHYTRASEAHSARETRLLLSGEDRTADIHHRADRILCRALLAEQDDPTPKGLGE